MSAWCAAGQHVVRTDDLVWIGEDYLPGDQTASRYACPACVEKHGLTPPVSAFVGRQDAPPIPPGRPA